MEPNDTSLKKLSEDNDFIKNIKRACEINRIRYEDVQRCMGGLYHNASKSFHGHIDDVVIDSRSWSSNEVLLLGVLFEHYKIPYVYFDIHGKIADFPYKTTKRLWFK